MNENSEVGELIICGQVAESNRCSLISEIKRLLHSSNKVYIHFRGIHMRDDPNVFMVAWQDPYLEDPSWRLEVWVTVKDVTASVFSEGFDISSIAYDAWSLRTSGQTLRQLRFGQVDIFDHGEFADFIYARENMGNINAVAEIIFELIKKFTSFPDDDPLYDFKVDWSFVKTIQKLKGLKRKIVKAYLQVLLSDRNSSIPDEKLGWRTKSKIANELQINRQDVYKYNGVFVYLHDNGLLARRPYVGPGGRWKDCWEYRINCNHETVQKILSLQRRKLG